MKFILGKKLGATQLFDKKGKIIPVTLIEAGPCLVMGIRTPESNGYTAIKLGFQEKKTRGAKKKSKPQSKNFRYLREFKVTSKEAKGYNKGDRILVSCFREEEKVKVAGASKGKGFQGVVRRWGFKGGPASHGHRHNLRAPGSIGSSFPEKVRKGLRMAGRMGGRQVTVKGLKIVKVDLRRNILAVKGAVPGAKGGLVEIRTEKNKP